MFYKIPLLLEPQPEGGFTVTSPILPELVTEGNSVEEVLANAQDALHAIIEAYEDLGRSLPSGLRPAFLPRPHFVFNRSMKQSGCPFAVWHAT